MAHFLGVGQRVKRRVIKKTTMETLVKTKRSLTKNSNIRNKIMEFESVLMQQPGAVFGDNELCRLKHSFSDGIYIREMFVPKGVVLTGKIHKHNHPYFILSGEVTIVSEQDGEQRLRAPVSIISSAGTKRVIYAHEDTILVLSLIHI